MASASGIRLLKSEELNPELATTYGTGQLINKAMEHGCSKILLGLGGSATVDGGIGMLDAIGFRFFDKAGTRLPGIPLSLGEVERIEYPSDYNPKIEWVILCDVNNPITGENGASRIFGPQKGADSDMVERLEERMYHWVGLLEKISGRSIANVEGMGAAGGISSGLVALLGAELTPGASAVFDLIGLDKQLEWADLVVTGEGKIDLQSLSLKGPVALAQRAKKKGKPVIALSGSYEGGEYGDFDAVFTVVNGPVSLQHAIDCAYKMTFDTAANIAGLLLKTNPIIFKIHENFQAVKGYLDAGDFEKSQNSAEQMPESQSLYWYAQGLILQKRQQWGSALNAFIRSLEIDPGLTQAVTNISIIREILNFTNPALLDP